MRRFLAFMTALVVAAACTPDNNFNVQQPTEETVSVIIEVGGSAEADDTRLALDGDATAWEVGDSLYVMFYNGSTTRYVTFAIADASQLINSGKQARFSGDVPVGNYTRVVAFYPGNVSSDAVLLTAQATDNIFLGAVKEFDSSDPLVVAKGSNLSLPMSFSHLMHKIDYKLSLASGYTSDDLTKSITVEMVVEENGTKRDLVQASQYSMLTGTQSSSLATSKSFFADLVSHNFASDNTASALVFPFSASNVVLTFNVYVDGVRKYEIRKPGEGQLSTFTMSAGRSTTVNLALSEDNLVKEESSDSGSSGSGIVSDFNPDYYITTFKSGVSDISVSYGVGFRAYVNNSYIDVHFPSSKASTSSITEGSYTWSSSSWFGYNSFDDFTVRNGAGLYALGLKNSTTLKSGSMEVAKSGNTYIIDITLTDANSKTVKIQYIGELNVENGGQTSSGGSGSSGSSSASSVVALTSMSYTATNATYGYHSFTASDASGNTLNIHVNPTEATVTSLGAALTEYIAKSYAGNEGYFHADGITLNGTSRSDVVSGMMHVLTGGTSPTLAINLTFSDGTSQLYTFGGTISSNGGSGGDSGETEALVLTTSKTSITADNSDYAYLTVTQGSSEVTDYCTYYANGTQLSYNRFQTATAGTYTIYAMKDGVKSNEVTVTATAPVVTSITLSADRTSIRANGSDTATFSVVDNNGTTVTSSATFYVNSVNNNGNTFATTSTGTYSVYATYQGLTSNTLTVTATATTSDTTIVWADGVTQASGWYDCNKIGNPTAGTGNGDSMMCWAASSANIIEWWQDRYKAAGKSLPSTAITGKGTTVYQGVRTYELALMEMFYTQWGNHNNGSSPLAAIPWYFEGVDYDKTTSTDYRDYPLTSGGYWSSVWSSISPYLYKGYDYLGLYSNLYVGEIYGYSTWETSGGLSLFTQYMDDAFSKGIVSMVAGVDSKNGAQHAVTLWGYEKDNTTGKITRMWITDSDDALYDAEPRTPTLNEYNVTENGNCVVLSGTTRYSLWIRKYYPVSMYGSN